MANDDEDAISTSTLTLQPSSNSKEDEAISTSTITLSQSPLRPTTEVITSVVRLSPTTTSTSTTSSSRSNTNTPVTVFITKTNSVASSSSRVVPISIVPVSVNSTSTSSSTIQSTSDPSITPQFFNPVPQSEGPSCWEPTEPCGTAVLAACGAAGLAILTTLACFLYFRHRRKRLQEGAGVGKEKAVSSTESADEARTVNQDGKPVFMGYKFP